MMLGAPDREGESGIAAAPGAQTWIPREVLVAVHDMHVVSVMLEALRRVLPQAQLRVTDGTERLATMLASARPALVLADLNLVDYTVRDLITHARALNREVRVVVVVGHGGDDRVVPALRAGAAGFLLKLDSPDEVAAQLGGVIGGVLPMTPALARQLIRQLDRDGLALRVSAVQSDLLARIALGDTPAEAAWRLKLERDAVRKHVQQVFEVLQLPGTAEV